MSRYQQRVVLLLGLLLIGAAMLGCASNERLETTRISPSPYEQDLVRARASVAAAEQAGAQEFGGAQLALAREKLREAEAAVEDGEIERAQRLVVEANLDAELALAITQNRETQALVTEVQSGLRALEEELRREGAGLDRR